MVFTRYPDGQWAFDLGQPHRAFRLGLGQHLHVGVFSLGLGSDRVLIMATWERGWWPTLLSLSLHVSGHALFGLGMDRRWISRSKRVG